MVIDTQSNEFTFKYGKIVRGKSFINRTNDIKRIQNNIAAGINTILISPRRWGKSSLIKQLAYQNSDKKLRFAFIDFFNIRTEQDFLEKYSREIINLPELIAKKKGIRIVVCID